MTSYDTGSTLNHFNFSNIYVQQFPDKISQKTETLAYESQHKIIKLRFHCFKRRLHPTMILMPPESWEWNSKASTIWYFSLHFCDCGNKLNLIGYNFEL